MFATRQMRSNPSIEPDHVCWLCLRERRLCAAHCKRQGIHDGPAVHAEAAASPLDSEAHGGAGVDHCSRFALSLKLQRPRFESLSELALYFGEYIYSTNGYRQPRDVVRELFAAKSPGPGALE